MPTNHKPLPSLRVVKRWLRYEPSSGDWFWLLSYGKIKRGAKAGHVRNGRTIISLLGQAYLAHRLAWLFMTAEDPAEMQVDHINRDALDNRFSNLRIVNAQQQAWNRGMPSRNTSGHKNIFWDKWKNKWVVAFKKDARNYRRQFDSLEDAVIYAKNLRDRLHGEFACHGS